MKYPHNPIPLDNTKYIYTFVFVVAFFLMNDILVYRCKVHAPLAMASPDPFGIRWDFECQRNNISYKFWRAALSRSQVPMSRAL